MAKGKSEKSYDQTQQKHFMCNVNGDTGFS